MQRVLFITKLRSYGGYGGHSSSGLRNSARFVSDMLETIGVRSKVVSVIDNNDIDREVTAYRPTVAIIEALWVVPEKFNILTRLHPHIVWIVRGHSDIPFLANEGIAMEWVREYVKHQRVFVAWNDPRAVKSLKAVVEPAKAWKVLYLPNYYPLASRHSPDNHDYHLNVGCFGAIRPMKNQLLQAIAAIRYAESVGKILRFHINTSRCEQGGEAVLKNLRALFANIPHHLIEHSWLPHNKFLDLLHHMDYSLAVSFSETFCIVAADSVAAGVPLICSSEVPWAGKGSIVPVTDADAIVLKMHELRKNYMAIWNRLQNRYSLAKYSRESKKIWRAFLQ